MPIERGSAESWKCIEVGVTGTTAPMIGRLSVGVNGPDEDLRHSCVTQLNLYEISSDFRFRVFFQDIVLIRVFTRTLRHHCTSPDSAYSILRKHTVTGFAHYPGMPWMRMATITLVAPDVGNCSAKPG